jgi:hypothetical protein
MTERAESRDSKLGIAPTGLPDECEPWLIHLRVLAVKKRLRGEQKILWQYIWNLAGCQPGRVVIDLVEARKALGFSDTGIRRHLTKLVKVGLLEICYWAAPGRPRVELADPAGILTDDPERPPLRVIGSDPQRWFAFLQGSDTTPEAVSTPEAVPEAVPEAASEAPKGGSLHGVHGIHREEEPIPPSLHRTTRSMDHGGAPPETPAVPLDRDLDAMRIGYAQAAALTEFGKETSPNRQKEKLVKQIRDALQDPKTDPSIPARVADLVINGEIPLRDLKHVLEDIEGIRRAHAAGKGEGFTTSPGAFLLAWARKQSGWKEPKRSTQ